MDADMQARIDRLERENARLREALANNDWHSPYESPGVCGATAIRVLVRLERIHNPPALNAPPHYAFGHCIENPDAPFWPANGWFFDGQDDEYRVAAWRYIDPPPIARAALNGEEG